MAREHDESMMNNLYWWGVPTLFRCPHIQITDPHLGDNDIALIGVPHSAGNGTTERDQHLGPRAVRHMSAVQRRVHGEFNFDPFAAKKIIDAGDVPFPRANDNEDCIAQITSFYKEIDEAGLRPVSIGGDHSITGGIVQALGGGKLTNGEPICFLHLDAHTDVFTKVDHFLGARKSAAHWGAYLADQGQVDPTHSMQIGLRGHPRTLDWLTPSYEYGYNVVTMADYRQRGAADVIAQIKQVLDGKPVYITFDLDCLDPTIAPAVANVEAGYGGFTMDEARGLLHAVRGMNIIGGDVVCLMPTKDAPNNITSMVAGAVMFEIMSMIAEL